MKILTSAVNNPIFIEIQFHTLKKYFLNEYEFIVFNDAKLFPDFTNGNDTSIYKQIEDKCNELGIKCIKVPNDQHKNISCSVQRVDSTMNFMLGYMLNNKDEYLILDSDMFLIDYFNINKYRDYDCAIVLQERTEFYKFKYIWNGIYYFNFHKMKNIELLNWNKIINSDTGGSTYKWLSLQSTNLPSALDIRHSPHNIFNKDNIYFIKHLWSLTWDETEMPDKIKNTQLANFIINDPRNKNNKFFCEIYDDIFLHYRGGGDWYCKGLQFHFTLANQLKDILIDK